MAWCTFAGVGQHTRDIPGPCWIERTQGADKWPAAGDDCMDQSTPLLPLFPKGVA